jgi:hypothetical protein
LRPDGDKEASAMLQTHITKTDIAKARVAKRRIAKKRIVGERDFACARFALVMFAAAASSLPLYDRALAGESDVASITPSSSEISEQALLKKIDAMEQRIRALEAQLGQRKAANASTANTDGKPTTSSEGKAKSKSTKTDQLAASSDGAPAADQNSASRTRAAWTSSPAKPTTPGANEDKGILGLASSPVPGLSLGAYGEVFFGGKQNPAAGGQWQSGFDARRFVLLPTYAITDNIIFNAEIEFEHAGSGFDNDDKLHGTAEIEQLWVDFKIADPFNWRAPGVDLVPIGYINQHHEPTEFYSVLRPELYNGLIPSTWKVPATSIYGTIADGVKYQVMLSTAQEDFGDSFDCRTAANTVPPGSGTTPCTAGGAAYFPGIDGLNGLAFSNPPLGDFSQLSNSLAVSGRVDFMEPASIPGLAWSLSAYYTPNTTPRGAHGDLGNLLGSSSLAMFDAEFRYRVPNSGWEFRGEAVYASFGNPANLRANNDTDPTDNVGKSMYGYSAEAAYHIPLGTILHSDWEAVPFYRYTYQNLQTGGFAGTDLNMPTGAGQTQFHSAGVAVFPSPNIVLKATYQKVINRDPAGANSDSILGAVGFFF